MTNMTTTSTLTFAGDYAPLVLDGAQLHAHPESGMTALAGWAPAGVEPPSGDLCLPLVEHGGRRLAVADVSVDVSHHGGARAWVDVRWQDGHELEGLEPGPGGRFGENVVWLLRARTLKLLKVGDLVEQVVRYGVALASGHRDPRWARRLQLVCVELRGRDPLVRPRQFQPTAQDDPVRLLHGVMAAGGHLAITAGELRARVLEADTLPGLNLVTIPRELPEDPAAPVLLVNGLEHTLRVLRACEAVAAEDHARLVAPAGQR
ncbi:hypothetical protein [Streptomyces sp. NPDC093225]|uniref:hypothetical protein n=1 Tax=Streptomyces sp. NPDC093225 TaxID=3366034 RepID=UPI00380BAC8E